MATIGTTKHHRALAAANYAKTGRAARVSPFTTTRVIDHVERVIVLLLYGWFALRVLGSAVSLVGCLLLASEGLVVVLVLIRRPTSDISPRWADWLMAFAGTTAPLLVQKGGVPLLPTGPVAVLMLVGIVIQLHAKLILGRSFGCVAAHRGLKLDGPYRFIRHPIYFGYMLTHVGFLLVNPTVWNCTAYAFCYAVQVPRLLAEERLLARDRHYQEYTKLVRFRLIPGVF